MAITIKNEHEIALMRESGRLLALVHEEMRKELKEGMTTKDIDQICETMIRDFGCIPNFLNYQGFPASVCVSINDEVVHGIPSKKRYIQNGDIVLMQGLFIKDIILMQQEHMVLEKSVRKHRGLLMLQDNLSLKVLSLQNLAII